MNLSEEDTKKVEVFLIDRTRGISVPAMEWMIFDEMQNAPTRKSNLHALLSGDALVRGQ